MALQRKGREVRDHIVETANGLFYHQGYNQTSFSDIAEAAHIPRGNFYYYFKTKAEILEAVIERRTAELSAMLEAWDQENPDPRDRLKRFARIPLNAESDIVRYGCPVGSLNVELGKTQSDLQARAVRMFEVFREWLVRQLRALDHGADEADAHALHLLAATQGVTLIANVYGDSSFLRREIDALHGWIDTL